MALRTSIIKELTFAAVCVLLGLAWFFRGVFQPAVAPAAVATVLVPQRTQVHSLGRLEPASRILELFPESGNEGVTVRQLHVAEGEQVESGQLLVTLDNTDRRRAKRAEAEARLRAAEVRLQQVQAGAKSGDIAAQRALVALAERQSELARREADRARQLQARKAISDEQLEEQQWELDRLLLEKQRAEGTLAGLLEIRETDVRAAQSEIDAARAALETASAELAASELRAPIAGRVLRILTYPGERIDPAGLLELANVGVMQAVAEVYEGDVSLLRTGLRAKVVLDASGEELFGVVAEIGNAVARKIVLTNDPVSDTDARVVEVRIDLEAESARRVERLSNARVEVFIDLGSANQSESSAVRVNPVVGYHPENAAGR
ncbi:MAG: HlyD family efflux transporter periplasmic adaptor subunit [Planctomyces sp.]|nr:HlyD family efflux transporter periplasmic adaptor subunit [Planctomyces sp.]